MILKILPILVICPPIFLRAESSSVPKSKTEADFCILCEIKGKNKAVKAGSELLTFTRKTLCGSPLAAEIGQKTLNAIVDKENKSGVKAKEVFLNPTSRTANSVTYKFPERTLKPGEALYFAIPGDLQERPISFVTLGHRQDPTTEKGSTLSSSGKKWDEKPGLSSFQAHAKNFSEDKAWRYWNGMSSGDQGAKFAEPRHELEMENLYEWQYYGSADIKTGKSSQTGVLADGARVVVAGEDDVKIGELTIKMTPPEFTEKVEHIFTDGSSFNEKVGEHPHLGGGQVTQGKFPNALKLDYSRGPDVSLPKGWVYDGESLYVPLPKGKVLSSVEVLGGDSHPDGIKNKDGGWGTTGWAKASLGVESKGNVEWFVRNENVPPEGVITGTPADCKRVIEDGDRIVIRGTHDAYYIMGVRIGLRDK